MGGSVLGRHLTAWHPIRGGHVGELPIQASEGRSGMLADGMHGEDAGMASQADDPLDLVRESEGFGVADGGGQQTGRGLLQLWRVPQPW